MIFPTVQLVLAGRSVGSFLPTCDPRSFLRFATRCQRENRLRLVDRGRELRAASVASNASGRLRLTEDREEIEEKEESTVEPE